MQFNLPFIFFSVGVIGILLIATVGAVLSRKYNFNYTYLAVLQLMIYIYVAYKISLNTNFLHSLILVCLMGIFDATICFDLSRYFNANFNLSDEELDFFKTKKLFSILFMLIFSIVMTFVGYGLTFLF